MKTLKLPMGSLRQHAKTTNEILAYAHDLQGFIGIIPKSGEKLIEYGNKQWIELEAVKQWLQQKIPEHPFPDDRNYHRIALINELLEELEK